MKNRLYKSSVATTFIYLLLTMCTLSMVSCQEVSIDSQAELPLKLVTDAQPEYVLLASLPRDVVFTISSNTPWKIESDQNWCIPTPGLSSASSLIAEIMVKIEKNETEQPRTATLTIKADHMDQIQKVTIVQDAKGKLEVQPIEELFATAGDTKIFTLCANKAWNITSSSTWLTLDISDGQGDNKVTQIRATATANNGAKRKATVTIKSGLEERTFDVTQSGIILELPEITVEEATFASMGGMHTYKVNANTAWKAELVNAADAEWVTLTTPTANELTVKATSNSIFVKREAKIRFVPKAEVQGMDEVILTVYQGVNFWNNCEEGNTITYDTKGAAAFNVISGRGRLATNSPYKLGKFTWDVSSINLADDAAGFEINAWPDNSPTTAKLLVWIGNGSSSFTCGGGFQWHEAYWTMTTQEIAQIKTIVLTVEHDPANIGKLRMTLQLDDKVVSTLSDCTNVFTDSNEKGAPFYFGLSGCVAPASCVINSFEVVTYE